MILWYIDILDFVVDNNIIIYITKKIYICQMESTKLKKS